MFENIEYVVLSATTDHLDSEPLLLCKPQSRALWQAAPSAPAFFLLALLLHALRLPAILFVLSRHVTLLLLPLDHLLLC